MVVGGKGMAKGSRKRKRDKDSEEFSDDELEIKELEKGKFGSLLS